MVNTMHTDGELWCFRGHCGLPLYCTVLYLGWALAHCFYQYYWEWQIQMLAETVASIASIPRFHVHHSKTLHNSVGTLDWIIYIESGARAGNACGTTGGAEEVGWHM